MRSDTPQTTIEQRAAIKQLLRDSLRVEVETTYVESHGPGNSQHVEVRLLLDGEVIASDTDIISIPDNGA